MTRWTIIMFFIPFLGWSQIGPDIIVPKEDPGYNSNYIKSYYDDLCLTIPAVLKGSELVFNGNNGTDLNYQTNMPINYGFGIDYRWLTFEYTRSVPVLSSIDPKRGQTEAWGFGFGLTGRKFWFKNFIEVYQGYHLSNSEVIDPNYLQNHQSEYYFRPDITTLSYFASLNYGFNHRKFSNTASLWNLEQQKKSAGSWTVGTSFGFDIMLGDSAFVPGAVKSEFEGIEDLQIVVSSFLGINFGYLYQWVIVDNYVLSAALIPGLSLQSADIGFTDGTSRSFSNTLGGHSEFRLGFNYSNDIWYGGATLSSYAITNDQYINTPLDQVFSYYRFFVGYRFKIKRTRFMKKWFL